MMAAIDALNSTASVYTRDPELLACGYVDEDELRQHARIVLSVIQTVQQQRPCGPQK
jgi:hypothetical protein